MIETVVAVAGYKIVKTPPIYFIGLISKKATVLIVGKAAFKIEIAGLYIFLDFGEVMKIISVCHVECNKNIITYITALFNKKMDNVTYIGLAHRFFLKISVNY